MADPTMGDARGAIRDTLWRDASSEYDYDVTEFDGITDRVLAALADAGITLCRKEMYRRADEPRRVPSSVFGCRFVPLEETQ